MGKKNAEKMQFWTVDEFKRFIEHSKQEKVTMAFKVLFWTGIRRGELLALTFNDTISINKTYSKMDGEDIINAPKTPKSKRVIAISDSLADDIRTYMNSLYDYKATDRIFTFGLHFLCYQLGSICMRSGVKKIRVHDLRHSHASLLIELGFSPLLISERLGHEKIQTTLDTYFHLYPNKDSLVANKLDDLY